MNIPTITSFGNNFDLISINNSFEAEKIKPELTFENNINDINDKHLKSFT